jgi:hypothetical protein
VGEWEGASRYDMHGTLCRKRGGAIHYTSKCEISLRDLALQVCELSFVLGMGEHYIT